MNSDSGRLRYLKNSRVLIVLIVVIASAGVAVYNIASDTSVHGLTTKIFYASRFCTSPGGGSGKILTFDITAGLWSSSSLHTSVSQVVFSLSADGIKVGSASVQDASWDPGGAASYKPTFSNSGLNPLSVPATSNLVLSVTAQVSAGIATSQVTASDSTVQNFGTTSC